MPTVDQWAHLYKIRACLSPKEAAVAQSAIMQMSSDVLARWLAGLSALSVEDAVKELRSAIAELRPPRAPKQE
jgi:hypothetical protein